MRLFSKPVLCNYYLTYRCNAKCSFCDIWEKPSSYVNLNNLTYNLKDLKKLGVKVIDFTGGEPLLHQELHEFLKIAKKLGFITTVTTNTLLYPKYAHKLQGLIDMLHFSLDSPYETEHNQSRGVNCFHHFLRSIDIAKSLNEKPDILFTVHSKNIHQIPLVYEKFILPYDLILIINPIFSYNDIGSELSFDDISVLSSWKFKKNVYINEAFLELRLNGGNQISNPVCKAASTTVVISPENELFLPCYHLAVKSFPINNNLYELWNSTEVQNLIPLEGRLEKCQGCTINCYMQPSFAVEINKYFWKALPSTLKYSFEKWVY
jgi:MoaA/NifB/PqqE/SkfB family radical SAM enzyme